MKTVIALAVLALAGCATDVADSASTDGTSNSTVVEPSSPADTPSPDPTSEPAPTAEREDLTVTEHGYGLFSFSDDTKNVSWAVVLDNPNPERWIARNVDLTVSFYDEAGTVLGSESDSATAVLPGQTVALAGAAYEIGGDVAEMRVQARVREWEETEEEVGGFETSGVNVRQDQFGGWTVTGAVTSTFTDDFEDVYAVAVLRDESGSIVGGGWTFVDFVPGGGDTAVEVQVTEDIEGVVSADLILMLSNLSLY